MCRECAYGNYIFPFFMQLTIHKTLYSPAKTQWLLHRNVLPLHETFWFSPGCEKRTVRYGTTLLPAPSVPWIRLSLIHLWISEEGISRWDSCQMFESHSFCSVPSIAPSSYSFSHFLLFLFFKCFQLWPQSHCALCSLYHLNNGDRSSHGVCSSQWGLGTCPST